MHIIYHCVGGAHSSVIASAIHLGMLPETRVATNSEILSIPYYDNITREHYGRIIHRGTDEYGNNIYTTQSTVLRQPNNTGTGRFIRYTYRK